MLPKGLRVHFLSSIVIACLAFSACHSTSSSPFETQISILHVNLRGVVDVPDGDASGFWTTRFNRIGADLKAIGVTPDVIVLQEVAARVWCPDNHDFIMDYEPARAVLASLQSGVGVRYRIAYMQIFTRDHRIGGPLIGPGPTSMGGTLRECRGASGLALLYNPERIRNLETDTSEATSQGATPFDQNTNAPQLRRSMPCCVGRVRPGHEGVCGLIDGPPQTDVCSVPSPAGLATQVVADVAVARLELALRRNTTFHVYNVHLPWHGDPNYPQSELAVRAILNLVEPGVQRWIPPLMVGDFNNDQEFVREWLGDFDFLGGAPLDGLVYTLAGNPSHYNSSATVVRHETIQLPSGSTEIKCVDPGRLWSDHCGVLTTLVIREN